MKAFAHLLIALLGGVTIEEAEAYGRYRSQSETADKEYKIWRGYHDAKGFIYFWRRAHDHAKR